MNRRHALLVVLVVTGVLWCGPSVAFSQGRPDFGHLDSGGMPDCLIELTPMKKSSGWIVNANTPYTVWAAPKVKGVQFSASAWRPFGPYTLASQQRYIFNWDGASHGGRLATNPEITGTTPVLSPALASLHVQNFDGINVWVIPNPLPPGCDPNPQVPNLTATWHVTEDGGWTGTWTRRGGGPVFDAVWTRGGEKVTGVLTMAVQGSTVRIQSRQQSNGYDVDYEGTLANDGRNIRGTLQILRTGGKGNWGATIDP